MARDDIELAFPRPSGIVRLKEFADSHRAFANARSRWC
jgi:hypothetical protein